MGCCSARGLFITVCFLQLISSTERQVFDFLGQMWAPIMFNFVSTLVTIVGLFGGYYHRKSHVGVFAFWQLPTMAWNSFVAAFYLELGYLSRDSDLLNLGSGSKSWWQQNGPQCEAQYNVSHSATAYDAHPITVEGCLIPFYLIEVVQAALHFTISFFAFILAIAFVCSKGKDDNSSILRHDTLGNVATLPSQYSLTYHPHPAPSTISSQYPNRSAHHRRSANSLPGRRLKRNERSRGSARSTASVSRRKKRRQRANHDTQSIYQSQSQLMHNQFDVSSLDSFSPGNVNPLYSGSMASSASRYSLYTINPNATIERICVDHNNVRGQRSPIYMNSSETAM